MKSNVKTFNQNILETIINSFKKAKVEAIMTNEPINRINSLNKYTPCEFNLVNFHPEIENILIYNQQVYNAKDNFKIVSKISHTILFHGTAKEVNLFLYHLWEEQSISDKEYKILVNFFLTYI